MFHPHTHFIVLFYFLSKEVLLEAKDSEALQNFINEADVTVLATSDILHAAEISSKGREHEIDRNLFLKGILHKLSREQRKIYLVSCGEDRLENLKSTLSKFESDLNFAGGISFDASAENGVNEDDVVNEINSVIPDVIFTDIPTPSQEKFIEAEKMKINAKLLVALNNDMLKVRDDGTIKKGGIVNYLNKSIFKKIAEKYNKN